MISLVRKNSCFSKQLQRRRLNHLQHKYFTFSKESHFFVNTILIDAVDEQFYNSPCDKVILQTLVNKY